MARTPKETPVDRVSAGYGSLPQPVGIPCRYVHMYSQQCNRDRKMWWEEIQSGGFSLIEFFRLVDEHDGDVVLDFVKQFALIADESVALFVQVDVALALRTGEYFKKFFADGHGRFPPNRFADFINRSSSLEIREISS